MGPENCTMLRLQSAGLHRIPLSGPRPITVFNGARLQHGPSALFKLRHEIGQPYERARRELRPPSVR